MLQQQQCSRAIVNQADTYGRILVKEIDMVKMEIMAIDYRDFEKMIKETWPDKFDFDAVAEFEWNNGCDYLVTGIEPEISEDFATWLQDDHVFGPNLFEYLDALCEKKVIETGNYLIQVFW